MQRRSFLARLSLASALTWLPVTIAMAHTPYRFWNVFRKRNMQIMTSLEDEAGDDKGEAWVAVLRDKLPLSRAMVSRAHKMTRTASLLKTDQVKIAVLSHAHAQQMLSGAAPFAEFVPMQLEILVDDGQHMLVCRTDLPLYHGFAHHGLDGSRRQLEIAQARPRPFWHGTASWCAGLLPWRKAGTTANPC